MSIPTAAYLDTSVLDWQQYNFESTALSTFGSACAKRGVKLLLTDPTEREIKRHLRERAAEAVGTVEAPQKSALLAKFRGLERSFSSLEIEVHQAQGVAAKAWESFLKQFSIVRIG